VYRRSYVQPVLETSDRHRAGDTDPRKAYGVHKVECEDLLLGLHEREGFPATVARVGHTIGPHTPLVSREPAFFARLERGLPVLLPGDGHAFVHLVHIDDVARHLIALGSTPTAAGRAYNVAGSEFTSVFGCVQLMARVVGVEADVRFVPLDVARGAKPPLVHWGEALVGGAVFSIAKSLAELDWRPQFGLEAAYRDSFAWYDREGREQFEFDFSGDEKLLAGSAS
jgi:nucleoside-diphosphate-sugar epimerase